MPCLGSWAQKIGGLLNLRTTIRPGPIRVEYAPALLRAQEFDSEPDNEEGGVPETVLPESGNGVRGEALGVGRDDEQGSEQGEERVETPKVDAPSAAAKKETPGSTGVELETAEEPALVETGESGMPDQSHEDEESSGFTNDQEVLAGGVQQEPGNGREVKAAVSAAKQLGVSRLWREPEAEYRLFGPKIEGGRKQVADVRIDQVCIPIKAEKVIGHGTKQKLIEETKTLDAIKIVEIRPSLVNVRSIVKYGKVIVQGTLHQQIFYIGTDGLEHHVAEDIDWSDLVDVTPVDPAYPARPGMNQQDHSIVENLVFEFNPDTKELTKKVIIRIDVKVTETVIFSALPGVGPTIKAKVFVGEGTKQKFIHEEKTIADAVKIVDIVPSLVNVRSIVKSGKVIVQGTLHKQVYYVGKDNIVHHLAEDINWSELVEVPGAAPGMEEQDHSKVENLIFEFDPTTGKLIQKIIILIDVVVTNTQEVAVAVPPVCLTGTLLKVEEVIDHGSKQKLIEETKVIADAVKIVEIVPSLVNVVSFVKNGKVIVQGTLHKQIYYVATDGLVHHLAEDIEWSELIEVPKAEEGMNQQDHSTIENFTFEFDPATGSLTQKVIIRIDVTVTQTAQIEVCPCITPPV